MSIDAALDTIVEGFDVDGVLTEQEERERFHEAAQTKKVIPIIITGRSPEELDKFFNQHPEIANASRDEFASTIKLQGFREAKQTWPHADRYVYHGSGFRDRMLSSITNWEFNLR